MIPPTTLPVGVSALLEYPPGKMIATVLYCARAALLAMARIALISHHLLQYLFAILGLRVAGPRARRTTGLLLALVGGSC